MGSGVRIPLAAPRLYKNSAWLFLTICWDDDGDFLERQLLDTVSAEKRSKIMGSIGQRDTAPELAVRRLLHRNGFRFRLHRRDLPGKPDIVLPRHRLIILIHGCFWHRHPGCRFAYTPKSRTDFWETKFAGNIARDARVVQALEAGGWAVQTIWECETRDHYALEQRLFKILDVLRATA